MPKYLWERLSQAEEAPLLGAYHEQVRKELLPLFQHEPRVVLDIGCASGATSHWLKQRDPSVFAYGIELNRHAAAVARTRLDRVFDSPVEAVLAEGLIPPHSVDTVLLADVLEHTVDPWNLLLRLKPLLADDAQLAISLPNARNLWLINHLAEGNWRYAEAGLLDITHLRFFTLNEARRMLAETGYRILRTDYMADGRVRLPQPPRHQPSLDAPRIVIKDVSVEEQREWSAMQMLLLAAPNFDAAPLAEAAPQRAPAAPPQERVAEQKRAHEQEYWLWTFGRALKPRDRAWMAEEMGSWGDARPQFHLAALVLPGTEARLKENIATLQSQIYPDWRMTLLAFEAAPQGLELPPNVAWRELGDDEDSLEVFGELARNGEAWFGIWEAGDMLEPDALFRLARLIHAQPGLRLAYCDEDMLDAELRRSLPQFKPDFNLDLLRSAPYLGGLALFHPEAFAQCGGFDPDLEGAEEYDLALKVFERYGERAIGHVSELLYHRREGGGHCIDPAAEIWARLRQALQGHLDRTRPGAVAHPGREAPFLRVEYPLDACPKVSIIIPTKDRPELIRRCLDSLLQLTDYPDFEVIVVDNQTTDAEALAYYRSASRDPRVRLIEYPHPFNYSAINNFAARQAGGEYLLLLNNDTAVLDRNWLRTMMRHALRPDVGIVGPLLVFEDGLVQHAGIVLGLGYQPAEHIFISLSPDEPGYFGRLQLTQNYSAVTGACLLIRKSVYDEVGGLNETDLAVSFNDVDLCLKAGKQGYRVVWTPETRLLHTASQSLDTVLDQEKSEKSRRFKLEQAYMYDTWMPEIVREPAFNRQLTRAERIAVIENDPFLGLDPDWRPRKRILAHPGDRQGRGLYRIMNPARALADAGLAQAWETDRIYGEYEIAKINPDSVVLQEQTKPHQIEAIRRYKRYSDALIVSELDDLITAKTRRNFPHMKDYDPEKTAESLREAVSLSDRFVVSSPYLKEAYADLCDDIVVVPNYLDRLTWGRLQPLRRGTPRPRVGWAGGSSHRGDLEMLADVVRILSREVDWVFFGMCPDAFKPYVSEVHEGVPIAGYPARLASLDLDLALAPLEVHEFNRGKSNLRLIEYGILGYPVICTGLDPYAGDYPVTRVRNDTDEWVAAIRAAVADRDALARRGDQLRDHVRRHYILEDHLDIWLGAWTR